MVPAQTLDRDLRRIFTRPETQTLEQMEKIYGKCESLPMTIVCKQKG